MRTTGTILATSALIGMLGACGTDNSRLDKRSYLAGYNSFGRAYLPPSDEDRATVEAGCEEMWPTWSRGSDDAGGLNKDDWVTGCADYVEGKKSRF